MDGIPLGQSKSANIYLWCACDCNACAGGHAGGRGCIGQPGNGKVGGFVRVLVLRDESVLRACVLVLALLRPPTC